MKRQTQQQMIDDFYVSLAEHEQRMIGRLEERDRALVRRLERQEERLRERERMLDQREARFERTLGETASHMTHVVLQALNEVGPGSDFRAELKTLIHEEVVTQLAAHGVGQEHS